VEPVDVVERDGQQDDEDEHCRDAIQRGLTLDADWGSKSVAASEPRHGTTRRSGTSGPGYPSAMRLSHLFFTTLRDDPADAEMPSHRLLVRAGYVRQLGSGIYSLLPLGKRVNDRVEQVIREEQNAIGGQEIEMPVVHPADIWRASGRFDAIGPELTRFKDRNGRDMVLAMTHEEVVGLLLADVVRSWRQLPQQVYHFQTKWRDEPRARGGLIRVREFVMKDAYSADRDQAGLDASYEAQYGAYVRTFERLGLETVVVASDVGIMGGSQAHEFMVLNPAGEDVLVLCESGHFAANRQVAVMPKPAAADGEEPLPREEVATPGTTTIATLAAFLGVGPERTAKAAFFVTGDGRLVTAIVRGDFEVNETKLGNAVKAIGGMRPATVEEIKAAGMEPGYGSPIGAKGTVVVIDDLVERSPNLVAGANREGFHFRNVNPGRDYTADVVADITNAQEGDACPVCGEPVILRNGIEVGNIFKLGTKFTDAAGATYLGEDGVAHPIVMGSYGIGVGRSTACIVEAHHDDKGIVWPAEVAPYAAHLVSIGGSKEPRVDEIAERLHQTALDADREILWDDRDESPGVKFTDAELLGMPWILTVSPRSLTAGGIEVTDRATGERSTRPIEAVEEMLRGG
jgi:prolyl-tRNA synthetase